MPIKKLPLEEPTLNLTPMIDVILTLIIFFMVATKFSEEERNVELTLPSSKQSQQAASSASPKVVNVKANGEILLGTESVTPDELTRRLTALRAQNKKLQVVVRGDKNTTHGRMSEVYESVHAAGVSALGIAGKFNGPTKR